MSLFAIFLPYSLEILSPRRELAKTANFISRERKPSIVGRGKALHENEDEEVYSGFVEVVQIVFLNVAPTAKEEVDKN